MVRPGVDFAVVEEPADDLADVAVVPERLLVDTRLARVEAVPPPAPAATARGDFRIERNTSQRPVPR
jgi:hypothetical protein